jgi:hypothetical protein
MSQYYPAGKSSKNPIFTLQVGDRPDPILPTKVIFINPNTSYYALNTIFILNKGFSYPSTTTCSVANPEHPDGTPCELSLKFGLTKESLSVTDGGSRHSIGDVYYIFNSTEDNLPATVVITEVDDNGSIIDFDIAISGSGFNNNGIVVISNYNATFKASFTFNTNKFCIAECIIEDEGSGYALLNDASLPIEREILLSNYGSGTSFEGYIIIGPTKDENNNIIYPTKTHSSNPSASIANIRSQPSFRFDTQSQTWEALNDNNQNKPKCSNNSAYVWAAFGLIGAAIPAILAQLLAMAKRGDAEEARKLKQQEQKILESIRETFKEHLARNIGKGLSYIDEQDPKRIISFLVGQNPREFQRWISPYYSPSFVEINGVKIWLDPLAVIFPDDPENGPIIEALNKHKSRYDELVQLVCKDEGEKIGARMEQFIDSIKKSPAGSTIFKKFDRQKIKELTEDSIAAIRRELLNELALRRSSGRIDNIQYTIFENAINNICERVRRKSPRLRRKFVGPTLAEISDNFKKRKHKFSIIPKIKNPLCGPKRGTGGTGGKAGGALLILSLAGDYAYSQTNEELVNNVTNTLLSEFQLVPDSVCEVDRKVPEVLYNEVVDELQYLLKKYYLGQISQQELVDGFSASIDVSLLNNLNNGSEVSNQLQQLIDLVNEGDLKGLADDIANQTEWPEDFAFPWNVDRQVIQERTKRTKHAELALFLREQMINKFTESTSCQDLCGSGSENENFSLEEFLLNNPDLINDISIGLVVEPESEDEIPPQEPLKEFYSEFDDQ